MQNRAYQQIDVFGSAAGFGNPLAVVLHGDGLTDAAMQRFARWAHLSETTFLMPPTQAGADYRVRIFTPGGELLFAGHPTLGSCHAWLAAGGRPHDATGQTVVQQCNAGLVLLRLSRGANAVNGLQNAQLGSTQQLAFAAPPLNRRAARPAALAQVAAALGLQQQQVLAAQILDNGPVWLGLLLDSVQTVLALTPNHARLKDLGVNVGVAAVSPALVAMGSQAINSAAQPGPAAADDSQLTVRAFAAAMGVPEDPVTGSLNASMAQWLIADGVLPSCYTAAQGICVGHAGRVGITCDSSGQVWVSGACVTVVKGTVRL